MIPPSIRFRLSWLFAAFAVLSFAGLLALAGFSNRASAAAAPTSAVPATPPHPPAGGPPPMFWAMLGDPRHVDTMIDRLLSRADAGIGDDQREQLKAIFRTAAADLAAQRSATGGVGDEAMKLFVQPNVDAREVEALRQKTIARQDELSKRMTQAVVDASRLLTVEQRQKISATIAAGPMMGPMGGPPHPPHPPQAPADPSR